MHRSIPRARYLSLLRLLSPLSLVVPGLACGVQAPPGDVSGQATGGIVSGGGSAPATGDASGTQEAGQSGGVGNPGPGTGAGNSTGSTSGSTSSGPGAAAGVGDGLEEGSTMDCPSAQVTFEPVVPTVILLIDQSGSMNASFGGGSRWDAVRDALIDPDVGVVAGLQDDIRFGLALYTSFDGDAGGECPVLDGDPPLVGNLAAMSATLWDAWPLDETPTGESIAAVTEALLNDVTEGEKIIVVATDGEPDTCAQPNPQDGQAEAVAAVNDAFAAGVRTFIISVGNDVSSAHLQDMANAGIGWTWGDPDAAFYVPSDQDAMVAAFEDIIDGVRDCVLTLDTAILPGQADQGTVTVNGMVVPLDDPDGWVVRSATEIELLGATCALIQAGDVEIVVEFTCEAIVPG